MVERTFPRHFEDLNEKWRPCVLCGLYQLYPESQLVEEDGKYYCGNHHNFRFRNKAIDEYLPEIEDSPE